MCLPPLSMSHRRPISITAIIPIITHTIPIRLFHGSLDMVAEVIGVVITVAPSTITGSPFTMGALFMVAEPFMVVEPYTAAVELFMGVVDPYEVAELVAPFMEEAPSEVATEGTVNPLWLNLFYACLKKPQLDSQGVIILLLQSIFY